MSLSCYCWQLPHARPTLEVSSKGHPQFEGPRDHTRLIQHVKTLILTWVANCDTQVILEDDLLGLQKYVSAYACKGAATTEDLVAIYKVLVNSLDNNATVRSLAQRLLLRTVGMVDVPAAAADYILAGGALYHHTRVMRRVGLSGWRVLDVESEREHGKATRDTPLDRFKTAVCKDVEKKQKPSTLWEWAQGCNCNGGAGCGSDHAPLFTGAVSALEPHVPSLCPTWRSTAHGTPCIGTWHALLSRLCVDSLQASQPFPRGRLLRTTRLPC